MLHRYYLVYLLVTFLDNGKLFIKMVAPVYAPVRVWMLDAPYFIVWFLIFAKLTDVNGI